MGAVVPNVSECYRNPDGIRFVLLERESGVRLVVLGAGAVFFGSGAKRS